MGQKVNPIGLRLGINKTWDSIWYANKNYVSNLRQDIQIRNFILSGNSGVADNVARSTSKVIIQRLANKVRIFVHSSKPGLLIGKKGDEIAKIKLFAEKVSNAEVSINVVEIKKPEINAALIAKSIAQQIENRVSYKKAMKKAVQSAIKMGAKGIRVNVSGRLGGAEIARSEWHREGRIPLHTLRADIDYAVAEAIATYGVIGVKVWVFISERKKKM